MRDSAECGRFRKRQRSKIVAPAGSLGELIAGHELAENSEAALRLRRYLSLLEKWNLRVNLTASTEWRAVGRLFEEALWAARFYPETAVRHLDIGSGAGFPALPMRILIPWMKLDLVESRAKRAAFLETAIAELGLEGASVSCSRIEEYLGRPETGAYDIVSWKGLKLSAKATRLLVAQCPPTTRLWLFQGEKPPFATPGEAERELSLIEKKQIPSRAGHSLAIYRVSRGTCFT